MPQKAAPSTFQSGRACHLLAINRPFELDGVWKLTRKGNIEGDALTLKTSPKRVCFPILLKCAGDLVIMLLQNKSAADGS
jgi:hypothetical protein